MPIPVAARSKCGSTASRLLRLRVRILLEYGCLSLVSVVCCQAEVFCVGLITSPQDFYRLWCV